MSLYKRIIRPLLFHLSPERAHSFAMRCMQFAMHFPFGKQCLRGLYGVPKVMPTLELWEMPFKGYVGLAAGFDKSGVLLDNVSSLGFSFMEVGTITPRPQAGNPKPRLFRLAKDRALINRMGFNSPGVEAVEKRLAKMRKHRIPIFGNIGKNTTTANESASLDYLDVFSRLYPLVDAFVVNVSCPNVKSLCELQSAESLAKILEPLVQFRMHQGLYRPILLKLSLDASPDSVANAVHTAQALGVDAFVASNTTNSRERLTTSNEILDNIGQGGLSGAPLLMPAIALIRNIRKCAAPGTPIIGVGGIASGEDALAMLQAGASLVEVFTGFIYEGPATARCINQYLIQHKSDIPNWLANSH